MPQTEISYEPPGPISRAFMKSSNFVSGIMGPFGSGKSTACVMQIMLRAYEQAKGANGKRSTRWAVVRNTYAELKTTTIKTWHQWFPPSLGRWVGQGPPTHHIINDEIDLEVLFIALDRPDDIKKLLSMELTGAWINEAREIPKGVLDGLTGRVGRFPSKLMGGCTWSGIIMDTNPPDTDHWWYRLAEVERPEGYAFFKQPGGFDPKAENIENLPVGYYQRQVAGKRADWIKIYINAEYGFVQDGKPIYPEYIDSLHCKEFEIDKNLPIHIGLDFGLTPAAAIAQRTPSGRWLVCSEVVTEDMGAQRFAKLLAQHIKQYYSNYQIAAITGDPSGDQRSGTDENTVFKVLRANDIAARPAHTNDPTVRRDAVAGSLGRLIDGKPGFTLHPRCVVTRKGLSGAYCLKRLNVGGERFRDVPDKNMFSHICEALEYCFMGAGEGRKMLKAHRDTPLPRRAESYSLFED
jgi:RecA/RadA recombinase